MAKKKLKIFDEYYEAVMYCINNGLEYKRVCKAESRAGTSKDWFVYLANGKVLKA